MWDFSMMCLLTVLIIQYAILFIDTHKYTIWVLLAHFAQILINLLFGIFYGLGNTDELGAYTFDCLSNVHFWLILFCSCHICLVPVYLSKYFNLLFSDTIINNLRNKQTQTHFAKKMYIKKIEHMTKCTRSLAKFKKIYNALDQFNGDNFADRKMKEIVQMYKTAKEETTRLHQQGHKPSKFFVENHFNNNNTPEVSDVNINKNNNNQIEGTPTSQCMIKDPSIVLNNVNIHPKITHNLENNFEIHKVNCDEDSLSNLEY